MSLFTHCFLGGDGSAGSGHTFLPAGDCGQSSCSPPPHHNYSTSFCEPGGQSFEVSFTKYYVLLQFIWSSL